MKLTNPDYYSALLSRDHKFDGRFFVGVSSTRIYCRPVCRVRTPKQANCTFYPSAAAAQQAGFRPCLKCRPELAPGLACIDASRRYAKIAAQLIECGFLAEHSCMDLAARLGVTDRHLRRIFVAAYGVSPIAYAQAQRLLHAKCLLTDTGLPLSEVALTAGFKSLRRFNELFRARYNLIPSSIRKQCQVKQTSRDALTFYLSYRPPYDWAWILNFFAVRAVAGLEAVTTSSYARTFSVQHGGECYTGWIRITPEPARTAVRLDISASLGRVVPEVILRVRQLLDLDAQPDDIMQKLAGLPHLLPGLRLPGTMSGFEAAIRAILEQQISTRAATTLISRFVMSFGQSVKTPFAGVAYVFPEPHAVAALSPQALRAIGLTTKRAACILTLAQRIDTGMLEVEYVVDIEKGIKALTGIPGIGVWTASYIAMRGWSWPDIFLHEDYGIKQYFSQLRPAQLRTLAACWSPWRSYATLHFWHLHTMARLPEEKST